MIATENRRALLLGAGLVTPPLVDYLLQRDVALTIAANNPDRAEQMLGGHPRGKAVDWQAGDQATLAKLVGDVDLVISLLPATMHAEVAELCLAHKRHMVTASYVSPQMQALHDRAHDAGIVLLNELGVDPGIDHMSAMRVIDGVKNRGGRVTSFHSYCGGLPAPEANDNPWGYKFSWSPLGVLRATTSSARHLEQGSERQIPAERLFVEIHPLTVGDMSFEAYANRDSLSYVETYGLEGIETMFRGTLRWPGWAASVRALRLLGLLAEAPPASDSWAAALSHAAGFSPDAPVREQMQSLFASAVDDRGDSLFADGEAADVIERLGWLGLLGDGRPSAATLVESLAIEMEQQMQYAPQQRDMIAMQHRFVAEFPQKDGERILSTMIAFGDPDGDSAMARTVSLPLAIAARMVLDGEVDRPGVQIPVRPSLYEPILTELAELGITLDEETTR